MTRTPRADARDLHMKEVTAMQISNWRAVRRSTSARRALLLTGLAVAAVALTVIGLSGDAHARAKKQAVLKACTCTCYSGKAGEQQRGYLEMVPESQSCPNTYGEDCNFTTEEGENVAGVLDNCEETPEIEGKPRPAKKRFPRQTKKEQAPQGSYRPPTQGPKSPPTTRGQ